VVVLLAFRLRPSRFARGVVAGVLLLLLTGATRGEVGRLWIPVMPLLLVGALAGPDDDRAAAAPSWADAVWLAVLLAALDLVLRIRWML
jgi:hypothetical protein